MQGCWIVLTVLHVRIADGRIVDSEQIPRPPEQFTHNCYRHHKQLAAHYRASWLRRMDDSQAGGVNGTYTVPIRIEFRAPKFRGRITPSRVFNFWPDRYAWVEKAYSVLESQLAEIDGEEDERGFQSLLDYFDELR